MRYIGVENQITQPWYDTVQLAAAANQTVTFFAIPLNGVLAGAALKTYAHTNFVQAGRLEKGIELTITGISMFVRDTASGGARVTFADYELCYNAAHIDLLIGQVSFLHLPTYLVGAGGAEINYFSNITPAATEYKATHGIGTIANHYPLTNPLVLEDQESIQVDLFVGGAPGAVTDVTMVLWGSQLRPVR